MPAFIPEKDFADGIDKPLTLPLLNSRLKKTSTSCLTEENRYRHSLALGWAWGLALGWAWGLALGWAWGLALGWAWGLALGWAWGLALGWAWGLALVCI